MDDVNRDALARVRPARRDDAERLLCLWELLFDEMDSSTTAVWKEHARLPLGRPIEHLPLHPADRQVDVSA